MNNFQCTGRLTHDPEMKLTTNGKEVCSFQLAVDYGWGDNKKTVFMRFTAWGNQAKYISKLSKGDKVLISRSELSEREYTNRDGQTVKVTECTVRELESAGNPKGAGAPAQTYTPAAAYQPAASAPPDIEGGEMYPGESLTDYATRGKPAAAPAPDGFQVVEDDDDLPF